MKEEDIVRNAQRGDRHAYEILVRTYWSKIYRLAASIVGRDEAEDVACEVFLQAWRALPKFRLQSSFHTWLYRITVNFALRRKKKMDREEPMEFVEFPEEDQEPSLRDIEAAACEREQRSLVAQWVQQLPDELRTPLLLRFWNDLSYAEIAEILGIKETTARMRTASALKRLAVKWVEVFGEPLERRQSG
ncbi:MAG: sigma-70 family RNA polymerase sigma factor [Armatimonadetes bacterium]|nr:sigma-70 family RNA polymerase sigma factor [Armatimonadota bacterium]MDW8122655.1 sigma-70 family RNA polymerase sigma factor [Armatimonadota bacterium]